MDLFGEEPSAIEMVFAIYANVIELDENGTVLNAKYAEERACQSLRQYCVPGYEADPPFEEWETDLHSPPPRKDLI